MNDNTRTDVLMEIGKRYADTTDDELTKRRDNLHHELERLRRELLLANYALTIRNAWTPPSA